MKTLLLLRHSEAERHSADGDKGRALTACGELDAVDVGRQIQEAFGVPDLVVSSDAVRAHRTAQAVVEALGHADEIGLRGAIYEATVGDLLEVVRSLPDTADYVLLVGHNPGIEELAGALDREALAPPSLSPAALIVLELDVKHWQDVRPGTGRNLALLRPEDH